MISRSSTAERGVAIVGFAQSPIERHGAAAAHVRCLEICLAAISDAGLTPGDIDGFTTGALFPSSAGAPVVDGVNMVSANLVARSIGTGARWVGSFDGAGQLPGAVSLAIGAISSGAADYVLLHRSLSNPPGSYHRNPMTQARGTAQWMAPNGFWGPPVQIAFPYREYLLRYGAKRESMARVVVAAREAGSRIPWSYWRGRPLTVDDYMNARMIADPICLFDCDLPVDGAAAFVLTSADRASHLPHPPVYVAGLAQGYQRTDGFAQHWRLDDLEDGGRATARRLWQDSGLTAADIDLPLVYDGFSPFVYFWLEALGLCGRGEAHQIVNEVDLLSPTGLPAMVSGGSLGNGRMHGVPQMLEAYLQLSGRAGERQLPGMNVALACHAAPDAGGAVLYSNHRL